MVKFYGYLMGDAWLYKRGLGLGYPPATSAQEKSQIIVIATRDLRTKTGVYTYTKLRRVKNSKGKCCWCIAFASNVSWESLPTSVPSEEEYKPLQEELKRDGPPRWHTSPVT